VKVEKGMASTALEQNEHCLRSHSGHPWSFCIFKASALPLIAHKSLPKVQTSLPKKKRWIRETFKRKSKVVPLIFVKIVFSLEKNEACSTKSFIVL
jgi:hypothetical protein